MNLNFSVSSVISVVSYGSHEQLQSHKRVLQTALMRKANR